MSKMKLKKGFGVRPILLIALLVVVAVGVGTFIWNQHRIGAKTEDEAAPSVIELNGTISNLDIKEWGIKLSFKNADKVTYKIDKASGSRLELYARDNLLPSDDCGRLGITLNRSTSKNPDFQNTQVGNYYYYFSGSPGYCNPKEQEDPHAIALKRGLVSNVLGEGGYKITAR